MDVSSGKFVGNWGTAMGDDGAGVTVSARWKWECTAADAGEVDDPSQLWPPGPAWIPADVPGTAAGALRDNGAWKWGIADTDALDGRDWWFRCRFDDPGDGPWSLRLRGLATIADVWLNGEHVLHSENMFREHDVEIDRLLAENEISIRFAALRPVLAVRRPRPRWKSRLVRDQNQRWIRTTLLGRMDGWAAWAAPVGPWRPVELVSRAAAARVVSSSVDARCNDGEGGSVSVHANLEVDGDAPVSALLRVGDASLALTASGSGAQRTVDGTVHLAEVERWWPHTHGAQPRYPVTLEIDGVAVLSTTVGFRSVEIDRADDGFTFVVNGVPIFFRGALWVPPDVVSLAASTDRVRASLELLRDAGMNMLRIGGYGTYESPEFWDICDELGVMVWQDCMLASFDPPDDAGFAAEIEGEIAQVFHGLQGRPALALVCGSSETYQQASMFGLEPGSWESPVLEQTIPAVLECVLPGVPYIASSPIGGQLPFDPSAGVAHYFGVGAYLRPLSDARLADVRFAAECLAFSNPPERESVVEMFGADPAAAHTAAWKAGIARDSGTSWDFEDVRDFYVRAFFEREPAEVRYADPDWALDLGRAAVAEAMSAVMSEWRRAASRCAGGLVLSWQDLWPGAGWGIVDSLGRPKAPWYALRAVLDPVAVTMTDEGLSGLHIHVVNDRPEPFTGHFELEAFAEDGLRVEQADMPLEVGARDAITLPATGLLGGFRDLTRAYRFGPPSHDVVVASLTSPDGGKRREAFFLPLGRSRVRCPDVGLSARVRPRAPGEWTLTVTTELFAQWVAVDAPGFTPSDSWFHLAPGSEREIVLRGEHRERPPRGDVRALNSLASAPIRLDEGTKEREGT
jgi:beta-mannosidase